MTTSEISYPVSSMDGYLVGCRESAFGKRKNLNGLAHFKIGRRYVTVKFFAPISVLILKFL